MIRRVVAAALLAAALAACQTSGPTAQPSGGPTSSGARPSATAEIIPTLGPPPSPTPPDETSPVLLDPTVLDFLPETIGDVAVVESVDEATQALTSPDLDKIASALDAAVAVDTASGNLVYAWVVRLRPNRLTDAIYRDWRTSYDEGACSDGGMIGPAEATIDGRSVYVTTCTLGMRTYHVWLKDQGILISASAIGEGSFGEQLLDNLRVPA